jgi:hypothetical protein
MAETRILSLTPSDRPLDKGFRRRFFVIWCRFVKIVITKLDPLRYGGV